MSGKTRSTNRAEARFEIRNSLGLHLRPARMLANLTNKFDSDVFITKDSEEVNGKSIMGIITLAAAKGAILKVTAVGPDAPEAVNAVGKLIENKFGEED
ncbi:MAG: HPr family phosphocarrier protein [bacterium]|nr:HPr family phosphocarrier protein [bacterium]